MAIGLGFDSRLGLSLDELGEIGAEAARLGYRSLWTNAGTVPDAFHVAASWARSTNHLGQDRPTVGIAVVPVLFWHPVSLALQAATVASISDGRFILGIGTGGTGDDLRGTPAEGRPIAMMRDYLVCLRGLLSGERVDYDGPVLKVHRPSVSRDAVPVRLYLAGLGPKLLQLAGELADGVPLTWATPEQIAWASSEIALGAEASRRDRSVRRALYVRVCIDDDVSAARRALGSQVLSYALSRPGADRSVGYRGQFTMMGFDSVLTDLEVRRERGESLASLVDAAPDELFLSVGYYGSASEARDRFTHLSQGVDDPIVRIVTTTPGRESVVRTMRALSPFGT